MFGAHSVSDQRLEAGKEHLTAAAGEYSHRGVSPDEYERRRVISGLSPWFRHCLDHRILRGVMYCVLSLFGSLDAALLEAANLLEVVDSSKISLEALPLDLSGERVEFVAKCRLGIMGVGDSNSSVSFLE